MSIKLGRWLINAPNPNVALTSAPQTVGVPGQAAEPRTLTPAEAFQRRQAGDEFQYPDRRRPMQTTNLAGTSSTAGQGTFAAPTSGQLHLPAPDYGAQPGGTAALAPGRSRTAMNTYPTTPDVRSTYEGQSLLANGQVNPLAPGGVAHQGSVAIPGGIPDPPQYGYSNPQGVAPYNQQLANQQQRNVQPGFPAPPLVNSGSTLAPPNGTSSVPPAWSGSGVPSRPVGTGFNPRVAGGPGNGLSPVPASNQPANSIPVGGPGMARPQTSPTIPLNVQPPGQVPAARPNAPVESESWWQLVNSQNRNAAPNSGAELANSLNKKKTTLTSNKTPTLPEELRDDVKKKSEELANEPEGDSNIATLGLLFLSMGLNVYMGYLLRGFYLKTRQLARDLRETIASV